MIRRRLFLLALAAVAAAASGRAGEPWQQPPQPILDVLHAPELPLSSLSPTGETLALLAPRRYPPIAELATPMLRLAGTRIDPRTGGRHAESSYRTVELLDVGDGKARPVALPPGAEVVRWAWSADGRRFAMLLRGSDAIELWVGDVEDAAPRRVADLRVNQTLGSELVWMPDQRGLLVKAFLPGSAPVPAPGAPLGPKVQETADSGASSTYEARDVLAGPRDEILFEHNARSQLVLVDAATGKATLVGEPGFLAGVAPSPDGSHLLVERLHGPWSYTEAWWRFPVDVEVWDPRGALVRRLVRRPLADHVPIHGVVEGPREHRWRATEPATVVWIEAMDGGDPGREAPQRDRIVSLRAPFDAPPRELFVAQHRVQQIEWGDGGLMVVEQHERERRWRHVWAVDADAEPPAPRLLFDLSARDRYRDPGRLQARLLPDGRRVLVQEGGAIFLQGDGATPGGDRPFLDRLSLETGARERLFRCDDDVYEVWVDWIDLAGKRFLTRRESPEEVPNYGVRELGKPRREAIPGEAARKSRWRALTRFEDPTPVLRSIGKRIVTTSRADGTAISFTLYLPPGYREGTPLPTVLYAYPLEYSDPETAGQVAGNDRLFTRLIGPSHLFFLLDGYAVLHNVTMPVIGDPDTAYDSFVEQLVANAAAAIDRAVAMGVTDPERVGVMGHSHGALMTATLLAHSDLFRAGIARSGAYNHTMRPFGFQNERRTLWEARDTYLHLSPLMYAATLDEPLLLIHGEADPNPGTVPLQSEKLYEAIRGTGGTARLVMLPHELHGYVSKEGVEQTLAEQLAWFACHVKDPAHHRR